MIQEATLIEASLSIRTQIDFLWQLLVTVHVAIFALLSEATQAPAKHRAVSMTPVAAASESRPIKCSAEDSWG